MSDDWQDLALNSKRLPHGRLKRGNHAGASKFDPHSALGSYAIECSAISKSSDGVHGAKSVLSGVLEIHELTETPGGMIGTVSLDTMSLIMFLAGSRTLLRTLVEDAENDGGDESEQAVGNSSDTHPDTAEESDSEQFTEQELADRKRNDRAEAFAKNSFRQPKFWFQWQGHITGNPTTQAGETATDDVKGGNRMHETNIGYIVFQGNACQTFKGTISSKTLGWKNVGLVGRKTASTAKPAPAHWADFAAFDEGEET